MTIATGRFKGYAIMAGCLFLLEGCVTAYPGPGKTEAQLEQDVWNCKHFPPRELSYIRNFSLERCLVASGEIVKRADGTIVYPSQPQTVYQTPMTVVNPGYTGPSTSSYVGPGEIDPATVSPPPPAP